MAELIKLGALWIKKDKRGRSYLTGRFSASTRLMIFKNEYKTSDNQPDYEMYLTAIEPAEGAPVAPRQTDDFLDEPAPVRNGTAPRREPTPAVAEDNEDDEAETPDTRRPQPARVPGPAVASSPARSTVKPAASTPAEARPATRPSRNAPAPPDDFEDMDDPFEN